MNRHEALLVLGLEGEPASEVIEDRFRQLALEQHPDRGGSHDAMARLVQARDTLLGSYAPVTSIVIR